MLYRKIKLSTFGLYLKAVSKLWLVPLLTVNVLVPVISAVLYKNGGAGAESDIVTVMYFLLPISTVWTSIFVSEFFFSDRTRDVLFFYSRKKRFAVSQLFFLHRRAVLRHCHVDPAAVRRRHHGGFGAAAV